MYIFKLTGLHFMRFLKAISFLFGFIGHLSHSSKNTVTRHLTISWGNVLKILYYSGASLVIPLIIIIALMTMSLAMNSYDIFSQFHLQDKALSIAEALLLQDIVPILIALVLCVQLSLNIINARIKITKFKQTPHEVILEYILPIIIGVNLTGILLYIYLIGVIFLSLFMTFYHILNISIQVYLLEIGRITTIHFIMYSVIKTVLYCTIVSFTAGYYYYLVATRHIPLRRAVSRILTRGSLWLTVSGVYVKFLNL